MNENEHGHNPTGHHGSVLHGHHPKGKRERRGWPFWVALGLMLAALANYMLTGELGGWRHNPTRQPVPVAVEK